MTQTEQAVRLYNKLDDERKQLVDIMMQIMKLNQDLTDYYFTSLEKFLRGGKE